MRAAARFQNIETQEREDAAQHSQPMPLEFDVDAIEKRRQDRPFLKGRRIAGRAKENPAIDLKKRFWT